MTRIGKKCVILNLGQDLLVNRFWLSPEWRYWVGILTCVRMTRIGKKCVILNLVQDLLVNRFWLSPEWRYWVEILTCVRMTRFGENDLIPVIARPQGCVIYLAILCHAVAGKDAVFKKTIQKINLCISDKKDSLFLFLHLLLH